MRKMMLRLIAIVLPFLSIQALQANIILNEMMPCNVSTQLNDKMNYTGWVELYNSGTGSVNIKGYTFTNQYYNSSNELKSHEWTVGNDINIPAAGYVLLYFDEESGTLHAPYALETKGGFLILTDANQKEVSRLSYSAMYPHISWGKSASEEGYMLAPTPNKANKDCYETTKRVQKPSFGTSPGFYNSQINVTLSSEAGATIYYTTDGNEPTEQSTVYSGSIPVSKTTVIRARAYNSRYLLSEIATGTFLFNVDSKEKDYHSSCGGFTVPVVSISTNPDNFFGNQIGIYVVGTNGISSGKSCDPKTANYNQDWKRPVNFEYFVNQRQVVSQEMDAAVMGGCSRQYDQKSLKLTASNKMGNNKIAGVDGKNYDFFPTKKPGMTYKSLQLRNGGNDYSASRVRDGFMQTLIQGRMNIDYQGYQPVAFYINGEYWGEIDMRERTNKDFVYSNYGLDEDAIDLLEITGGGVDASSGDINAYNNLISEAKTGTSSPDYYEKMSRLMDLDEYIDYQIFEQYIVNTDWPGNNTKIWREKNTGRFRWIVYDTDFGFGLYGPGPDNYCDVNLNMINFALGQGSSKNWANSTEWMVELFKNLMKNDTFRQKFLNKYILHLGTTFVPSRVNAILDSVYSGASAEICAHWKKFSGVGSSLSSSFGSQRAGVVYNSLKDYFGLGTLVSLSISSNISGADFILNDERLNASKYNGKYYTNMNLKVQPVAPAGYRFVSWNLTSSSVKEPILNSATAWKYYYKGDQPAGNWYENSYNDAGWSSGSGKFGYASDRTYDVTLNYGSNPNDKYVTAYFRSTFTISDLSAIDEISGTLTYDDGVVIYLNGQEVTRYNLPTGAVSYETFAPTYVNDEVATLTIPKSFLKSGENVIAVEVHQNTYDSSDLTFKLSLDGKITNNGTSNQTYNANVTGDLNLVATFEKSDYVKPSLFINELSTSNGSESGFNNEYGIYADWIEIYNAGNTPVDLAGLYLSENTKNITYQFPTNSPLETTVLPGEHKIVWTDKEPWQGPLHADFKLSAETAATVILSEMVNKQQVEIDKVSYTKEVGKNKNESYGRVTDGASQWTTFEYCTDYDVYLATPGEANGSKKCQATVGIDEPLSENTMKLYPNPAKSFVTVAVNSAGEYALQVYDGNGRLMESRPKVQEQTVTLNVEKYASGVYIIKAVTQENVYQQKFIKY